MIRRTMLAWLVPIAALGVLAGCTPDAPDTGPPLIGGRTLLCDDRVDAAGADAVIGRAVADLHELTTFVAGRRVGECALTGDDGGALLSVQVVYDSNGKALSSELEKLGQQETYSGDDRSGVTGEGITTTALVAVDAHYYVRVLGLGGSSAEQRTAALALAEQVATRTAALK